MMYVIAANGTGDFTSVTEALNGIRPDGCCPTVLVLRDGTYEEQITISTDRIRLVGESQDRTVITWQGEGPALTLTGRDIELENLTVRAKAAPVQADRADWCASDCLFFAGETTWAPDACALPDRTPTLWVCGDSTSAICTPEWAPQANWTMIVPAMLHGLYLQSYARSGCSSKSFVQEGRLGAIELCLRKGDYLLAQFSHNDEKKPADLSTVPRVTFPLWLDLYIDAALNCGAAPVLMTPFERRILNEKGELTFSHGDYPHAMRDHARERGVTLLEMEQASRELFLSTGLEESKKYFMWIPAGHPNFPDGSQDNTHFCREGAEALAGLFMRLWQEAFPGAGVTA